MPNKKIAINKPNDLLFGIAPKPVKCARDITIGNGEVYPEINFTLSQIIVEDKTWYDVRKQYEEMIDDICKRSVELSIPALIVEFELLPPMTINPEWGGEITEIIASKLNEYYEKHGLKSALRITPVDIRDIDRPPKMHTGELLQKMLTSFEICARKGADMLSIESTGGKEIHDEALISADLSAIIFSLGALASSDMKFLWEEIVKISNKYIKIPAGDTACGFANTAMILADKGLIPKVLAAVVRTATIPRSLQAYLAGAIGPSKDCAYEGPFIKAITGVPISMEGKTSACAHLSHVGNIASAYCDLWSNESIPNVRLLSASAPVVSLEQLAYDCRLMNRALKDGKSSALKLQRWMIESDIYYDPQAYILKPDVVIDLSKKIMAIESPLEMTFTVIEHTLTILREAVEKKELQLSNSEQRWLNLLSSQLDTVPRDLETLSTLVQSGIYSDKIDFAEYNLSEI